ncbi:uncharacterized histidine-rich protein DDB_G0274557, partial [Aplysia californica]|uniref:Uncharacterized histidine-rich protein DDB_G0274557 n=1 Tax=Aplysia californica TaxID=6500 RepID=A0ABM1A0C7_APLCA
MSSRQPPHSRHVSQQHQQNTAHPAHPDHRAHTPNTHQSAVTHSAHDPHHQRQLLTLQEEEQQPQQHHQHHFPYPQKQQQQQPSQQHPHHHPHPRPSQSCAHPPPPVWRHGVSDSGLHPTSRRAYPYPGTRFRRSSRSRVRTLSTPLSCAAAPEIKYNLTPNRPRIRSRSVSQSSTDSYSS